VDRTLPEEMRRQVKHELVCAFLEFGLRNDIQQMIGVMPPKLWQSVFINAGWDIEFVGKEKTLERDVIIAGLMPISLAVLEKVRKTTGIKHPVLLTAPVNDDAPHTRAASQEISISNNRSKNDG
jgi:N-acyl-L-homoserine lactone synthetase